MAGNNPPSTKFWFIAHVLLPLMPFLLGGFVRYITTNQFGLDTFSSSDLAISLCLLSLFISQNLLSQELSLRNRDREEDIKTTSIIYALYAFGFVALYAIIIAFGCSVNVLGIIELSDPLISFKILSYAGGVVMIINAIYTQRSYGLRASLP